MKALDLFCGGGGVSVALAELGYEVTGVDNDSDSLETHTAAGHESVFYDLRLPYLPNKTLGYDLIWASPPCTAFSMAGKGGGRKLMPELLDALDQEDWSWGWREDLDPTVWLVLPAMHTIITHLPETVCMENVTQAGPVLDKCLEVLRRYGYQGSSGRLNAEEFGVAQTRSRYFVVASKTIEPVWPKPTHAKYTHPKNVKKNREIQDHAKAHGLQWWVSMEKALGWGSPQRPYFTLALGGDSGDTTGGGSGARESLMKLAAAEDWVDRCDIVALDRRAQQKAGGGKSGREMVPVVPIDSPSPSLTSIGLSGPFIWRRAGEIDPERLLPAQRLKEEAKTLRLTVAESARLQSFPDGFPWKGNRTAIARQIGNAVPPALALAVIGSASGLNWRPVLTKYLNSLYRDPLPTH